MGPRLDYQIDQLPPFISSLVPNLDVKITRPVTNIGEALDTSRRQYHSTRIIAILENQRNLVAFEKILGVKSLDLYNPSPRADGRGFVFGEARLPGRSGIVSTFRLGTGLPDSMTFDARVRKEVVHELGHMIGLEHCSTLSCVMRKSENVDDTDAKSNHYCEKCQSNLKELCH